MASSHLDDGDNGDENRRGTQAVLVEVPTPVRLAGKDLVGHITNKTFVQAQPRLVQQDFPLQCAAAIGDGTTETAGAFTGHLKKGGKRHRWQVIGIHRIRNIKMLTVHTQNNVL